MAGYLLYALIIGIILIQGLKYEAILIHKAKQTFEPLKYRAYVTTFPIIMGLVIGSVQIIQQARKDGTWSIDWAKLIPIGIVSLYGTTYPLLAYASFANSLPFLGHLMLFGGNGLALVSGIIFGYVLIGSFRKI